MQKPTQRVKVNEKLRNVFQTEDQGKSPETNLNETQISALLNEEFKIMVIKMSPRSGEQHENFNKKTRYIKST